MARWRSSIRSQTAWPTRWFEIAKQSSPWARSRSHFSCTYFLEETAAATSKWSPQQASSTPSYPMLLTSGASFSRGRSAHWPVKRVTGRFMGREEPAQSSDCPPARPAQSVSKTDPPRGPNPANKSLAPPPSAPIHAPSVFCSGGGTGRHAGLRSLCLTAWGFESPPEHHLCPLAGSWSGIRRRGCRAFAPRPAPAPALPPDRGAIPWPGRPVARRPASPPSAAPRWRARPTRWPGAGDRNRG